MCFYVVNIALNFRDFLPNRMPWEGGKRRNMVEQVRLLSTGDSLSIKDFALIVGFLWYCFSCQEF